MKKTFYLLIILLAIITKTRAQEIDTSALLHAYQISDCVFEGIIEDKCYYEDLATKNIYTSNRKNHKNY